MAAQQHDGRFSSNANVSKIARKLLPLMTATRVGVWPVEYKQQAFIARLVDQEQCKTRADFQLGSIVELSLA